MNFYKLRTVSSLGETAGTPGGVIIRMTPSMACPWCGRNCRPGDVENRIDGWRLMCAGCFTVLLDIEDPSIDEIGGAA